MKRTKVIDSDNLPARSPLWLILIGFMAIEVWDISGIWEGVIYAFMVIIVVSFIASVIQQEAVDLFKDKP